MKKYSERNNFLPRRLFGYSPFDRSDVEIGACVMKNGSISYTKKYDRQKLESRLSPFNTLNMPEMYSPRYPHIFEFQHSDNEPIIF